MTNKNAYAQSGVDVEAGYEVVERIKKHVARTERAGVMGALGGFGGMFDLSKTGVKEPVLISGTDGVGTKLMLAIKYDKHDTIGQDCVAMCVNDIIAAGAEPLYFLDYIATGTVSYTHLDVYKRQAKDIYTTEDEHVIKSVYKDQATMLNGARKETIKGKGVLNNQISSLIFEKLNAAGVATHFIKRISDTEQRCV